MSEQTEISGRNTIKLVVAWTFVGVPLAWGVLQTLVNAIQLFQF